MTFFDKFDIRRKHDATETLLEEMRQFFTDFIAN